MIFLALLVPLAVYLIALGFINRRQAPLLVPGSWDFWGLLFASSGFWLLGGPAILSGLHENWRLWWIFGRPSGRLFESGDNWPVWVLLAGLYFLGVVSLAAWQFWRARRLTSIYNIDADTLAGALGETAERLGLSCAHTGHLYVFSVTGAGDKGPRSQAFTTPEGAAGYSLAKRPEASPSVGPTTVLEVDPFPLLRHVTLRWQSGASLLRRQVEQELARSLLSTPTPDHEVGGWLQVLGLGLLSFSSLGCVTLQILNWLLGR